MARLAREIEKKLAFFDKRRHCSGITNIGKIDSHAVADVVNVKKVPAIFRDQTVHQGNLCAEPDQTPELEHDLVPPAGMPPTDDVLHTLRGERRSKVTFHIEPDGDGTVKLTVVHGDLEPDGTLHTMISGGWPKVISELKTLLEADAFVRA